MQRQERINTTAANSRLSIRLIGGLALVAGIGTSIFVFSEIENFSATELENVILSWGAWGVVASIGCMVLHSFVPFPAEFLAIANGMVYGPFWGVVITWVGAMLGAFAAFGLARTLGRPFVEFVVAKKNWEQLDNWTEEQGWRIVFISRFIPVIAFNLVNYAAGLARISWWTFTWSTGIGILPMTIMMVLIGSSSELISWEIWIFAAVITAFICLVFWRRFFRNYFFSNTKILLEARNGSDTRIREDHNP